MSKRARYGMDSRFIVVACSLLLIFPPLLHLYYIDFFGVNVVIGDEWDMVPIVEKSISGTLSFSDLFSQHNEHRIFFPRLVILALGILTRYNTVAQMYFSWVLLCLTGLILFLVYRRKFSGGLNGYLRFLPISLLLFGFRQYESLLDNVVDIYLLILGAVVSFSLLEASEKIDVRFVSSILGAILSSFSIMVGLAVWPVGLLQILTSGRRKDLRKAGLWCAAALGIVTSYLHGYVKPLHHPSLTFFLRNPLEAGRYLLTLIGAPLSYEVVTASVFGLALVMITAIIIAQGYEGMLIGRNRVWFSFILFAALSSLATMVARGGFGVEQALTSRYTPITGLGIVGAYFFATSISKSSIKNRSFGAHALLTLILLGLIVSYGGGWYVGEGMKRSREMGAYVLTTYKIQSDENILKYLYPNPAVARERAEFLEENGLNVFSGEVIDPSTLTLAYFPTLSSIETVDGEKVSQQASPLIIDLSLQETMTITGWVVDKQANGPASAVFLTLDGKIDIPAFYGLDRPEVASHLENPDFRFSGYIVSFSSSLLEEGEHTLSLKILSTDRVHYYYTGPILHLVAYK